MHQKIILHGKFLEPSMEWLEYFLDRLIHTQTEHAMIMIPDIGHGMLEQQQGLKTSLLS